MALTKTTFSMIEGAVFNVVDFGADPTGKNNSHPAIQTAVNLACTGGDTPLYTEAHKTVFLPAGVYKMEAPLVFPEKGYCAFVGEANSFFSPTLLQAHAGHMIVLGTSLFAASPRIENIVVQGNKTAYPGNHHGIVQTTVGSANTAFQTLRNVMVRDMSGVGIYMDFAFYCNFYDVTVAYNKTGGMFIGGGSGNNFTVCTQANFGYGIYLGAQASFGQFFIEGDCIDNNPAGLNLSNYALNIVGGSNRFGGTILTSANNNKTGIRVAGPNNLMSFVVDSSLVNPKVLFTAGANYNVFTGNLANSDAFYSGDEESLNTLTCFGPAGSVSIQNNGEQIFSRGNSTTSPPQKGLHVGYDPSTDVAYLKSTQPGVTNYKLTIQGSYINLSGSIGTTEALVSTASTPSNIDYKLPIYDVSGNLLGYIPIYDPL